MLMRISIAVSGGMNLLFAVRSYTQHCKLNERRCMPMLSYYKKSGFYLKIYHITRFVA